MVKRIITVGVRAVEGDVEAIAEARAVLRYNGISRPRNLPKPRYEQFVEYVEYEEGENDDDQTDSKL